MIINRASNILSINQHIATRTLNDLEEMAIIYTRITEKHGVGQVPLHRLIATLLSAGYSYDSISGKWRK